MSMLKIGWAEANITPDKKISLAGQFAERISQYVEKPLTVTAMAVDSGEDQAVFVSCDLGSVSYTVVKAARERIAAQVPGVDPMKVLINAIHTHTGPGVPGNRRLPEAAGSGSKAMLMERLPEGRKYVQKEKITANPEIATGEEVLELVLTQITKVVAQAWEGRKEGSFSNAFGRAAVGMCRRAAYSDGSAQMWGDTNTAMFTQLEGGNDSGIELLYVFGPEQKLTGIVANLACPAQCVQHRLFVSPDFWGEVKVLLRQYFGQDLFLLPQCSAAGDQCPVDLVRWVEPESDLNDPNCKRNDPPKRKADPSMFDLAGMRKAGKRIAREIIDVYEEGLDAAQTDVPFRHIVEDMQLPIRRTTMAEVAAADKAIREYLNDHPGDVDYNDAANLQRHLGVLRRAKVQETVEVLPTEVHIIRMGTIAFASNPFELFLDYGNQIKARSLAEQTFLIQLCCGTEGYLPTQKAEQGGHYSAFIGSGQIGHVGGEQLVRQTLQQVNKLFD